MDAKISLRFVGALVLAALSHWALLKLALPELSQTKTVPENPLVVEAWQDPQRPVVESSLSPDSDLNQTKADFVSSRTQRTKRQTQSLQRGRMAEGSSASQFRSEGFSRDGEPPVGELSLAELLRKSASPYYLGEDIEKGDETVLNTDAVLYASFINRIADEIYDAWVENVQAVVNRLDGKTKRLETDTYITKLQVVMGAKGEVLSVKTMASSGVAKLDEAPKKAFWERSPFPYPPSQMLGAEELAYLVYEFRFEWSGTGFRIVPFLL